MEKGLDISVSLVMKWKFRKQAVEIKMFQMLQIRFITSKFNIYKTVQSCSNQKSASTNVQLWHVQIWSHTEDWSLGCLIFIISIRWQISLFSLMSLFCKMSVLCSYIPKLLIHCHYKAVKSQILYHRIVLWNILNYVTLCYVQLIHLWYRYNNCYTQKSFS